MYYIEYNIGINNRKLEAIATVFKTRQYSLQDCKYKIFILTNHKNP